MAIGDSDFPLSLAGALTSNRVLAGHTVYLKSGIYTSADLTLRSTVAGTAGNLTTISNVAGEEARVRYGLFQDGNYVRWFSPDYGLLRDDVDTNRTTGSSTSKNDGWTLDGDDGTQKGDGCELINLRVENVLGDGFNWFGPQTGLLYGNIISNNGWIGPDREHGPGHYMHNPSYDCAKVIRNTIALNTFRPGSQIGDGGLKDPAYNFTFEDFTTNARFFSGSTPADNLVIRRLWLCGSNLELGLYVSADNGSVLIEDCVIDAPLQYHIERFAEVTIRRCKFTAATNTLVEPAGGTTLILDDNEVASSGQYINVVPNVYAPGFATLSVLDLDEVGLVTVDISALLVSGTVRIHNPMLWTEYQDLTVTAGLIVLPMTGWTTPAPIGLEAPLATVFSARFGCFVIKVL